MEDSQANVAIDRSMAPPLGLMHMRCKLLSLFFCDQHIFKLIPFYHCEIFLFSSYYSNEVDNYGSPYGYSQSVATPQTIGYDISADFVDSTTAYEPRNTTIIDADFIGMHSMYSNFNSIETIFLLFIIGFFLSLFSMKSH